MALWAGGRVSDQPYSACLRGFTGRTSPIDFGTARHPCTWRPYCTRKEELYRSRHNRHAKADTFIFTVLFQTLTAGIQKFLSPSGIERPFNRSEMRRTVNEGCPCASRRRNQDPLGVGHNLCLTRIRAYLIGVAEIGG